MIEVTILRAAVLIVLVANVGVMSSVCGQYAKAWRQAPQGRRLKPAHVTLVTVCTLGLEGTLAWGQIDILGTPGRLVDPAAMTRTGLYGVFAIGLAVAIWMAGRWLKRAGQPGGPPLLHEPDEPLSAGEGS